MRVANDRYSRELRSFNLAVRMLAHEARPHTVCVWTGLSPDRVRNLSSLYRREAINGQGRRYRGPCPSRLEGLLTSSSLRGEAAAIAGLCRLLEVLPAEPVVNARVRFPSIARGERLCYVLELFHDMVPHARVTLDQLTLLVTTLAAGEQWAIARCSSCPGLVIIDRCTLERPVCESCRDETHTGQGASPGAGEAQVAGTVGPPPSDTDDSVAVQLSLFSWRDMEESGRQQAKQRVIKRKDHHAADGDPEHAPEGHRSMGHHELVKERGEGDEQRRPREQHPNERLKDDQERQDG